MDKYCKHGIQCRLDGCPYAHSRREFDEAHRNLKYTRACIFGRTCGNRGCTRAHSFKSFKVINCPFDKIGCSNLDCCYFHKNRKNGNNYSLWMNSIKKECRDKAYKIYPEIFNTNYNNYDNENHNKPSLKRKLLEVDGETFTNGKKIVKKGGGELSDQSAQPEIIPINPSSKNNQLNEEKTSKDSIKFLDKLSHILQQNSLANLHLNLHVQNQSDIPLIITALNSINNVKLISMNTIIK